MKQWRGHAVDLVAEQVTWRKKHPPALWVCAAGQGLADAYQQPAREEQFFCLPFCGDLAPLNCFPFPSLVGRCSAFQPLHPLASFLDPCVCLLLQSIISHTPWSKHFCPLKPQVCSLYLCYIPNADLLKSLKSTCPKFLSVQQTIALLKCFL